MSCGSDISEHSELLRCQLLLLLANLMLIQCRTTFCPKALGGKHWKTLGTQETLGCIPEDRDLLKVLLIHISEESAKINYFS